MEIKKLMIAHQKYHCDYHIPEHWVFVELTQKVTLDFLVLVDNHSAVILLPLIQQFIAPSSIVHLDK